MVQPGSNFCFQFEQVSDKLRGAAAATFECQSTVGYGQASQGWLAWLLRSKMGTRQRFEKEQGSRQPGCLFCLPARAARCCLPARAWLPCLSAMNSACHA